MVVASVTPSPMGMDGAIQMSDQIPGRAHAWLEIATRTPDAATKFYTELFGWGTEIMDMGPEMGNYTMLSHNNHAWAGVMPLEGPHAEGVPPHWAIYFNVDDVDAAAAKAASLGGQILAPAFDIEGVGRTALIQDPYGAVSYLFKSVNPKPEESPEDPVAWMELYAGDKQGAIDFYTQVMGWGTEHSTEMDYTMLSVDGRNFAGVMAMPEVPPHWGVYFSSPNVDDTLAKVKAAGGDEIMAPFDVPTVGRICVQKDAEGAVFYTITFSGM